MPKRSSTPKAPKGSTPAAKLGAGNHSGVAANKGKYKPDLNETGFSIVQQATGEIPKLLPRAKPAKNPAAVTLGRLGGLKGGKARANALTPEKRTEIARKAAEKRWNSKSD